MFNYSSFPLFLSKSDSGTAVVPNIELNAIDLIANFFVSCPRLGKKEEEEHKRILYYYPAEETPKRKVSIILIYIKLTFQAEITGMAGAVVGFTSELIRLNKGSLQKSKHRFIFSSKIASIFLPVEEDFIIGVTFNRYKLDYLANH
jgi:hypothetical protein